MGNKRQIIIIAHNLRSSHNVGSLLRTAEGLGINRVILSGYTPYPVHENDQRLPHLAKKITKDISKTGLGAETSSNWQYAEDIKPVLGELNKQGFQILALEQHPNAVSLPDFKPPPKCAIIIGREVEGIEDDIIKLTDGIIEIPMFGQKESFNVVQAAAMALYHCKFN